MKHIKLFENFENLKKEANDKIKDAVKKAIGTKQDHNWEVSSATRKDGVVINVGDKYKDGNNKEYEIKKMYISDKGKLMADAIEGGSIDLLRVSIVKK